MHSFKATVRISVDFPIEIEGAFNQNYKCGRKEAEKRATELVFDLLPNAFCKCGEPIIDAVCEDYEITGTESEDCDD